MTKNVNNPNDLDNREIASLIIDFFHRTMMHHAMWYAEVQHQFGREKAQEVLKNAYKSSFAIQKKRLGKVLGFELEDDVPKPLADLPKEKLLELKEAVAVNWLATDGVWFQSVEFTRGMFDAKRCNDTTWAHFSPFEAWSIKEFLGLPEKPGLEGLKEALNYRLYGAVNKQSFTEETENSFVFQMNDCRVQSARKRKGLDDYPCKSGGLVEYTTFAEAIDSRIKTECIGCPPDPHPEEWYCAWRFSIEE
ncbi:MAG: cytosolic protein [Marinilabiliales bacterium]|nr:MAG: cytosolic protein [Marinilabiliales bacterium]